MKKLDLTDPLIFSMADKNHVPFEGDSWDDDGRLTSAVTCETCNQAWPCSTRVELGFTGDTLAMFEWGEFRYHMIRYHKDQTPPPFMFADGKVYEMVPDDFYEEEDDEDV